MTIFLLNRILRYILIIVIICILIWVVNYKINKGIDVDEKLAGAICAKLIYDNITKDFAITKVVFDKHYTLSDSMITLYVLYNKKILTTSDCIIVRNYKDIIYIKKALLVNPKGKLIIYSDLQIKYAK